MQSLTGYNKIEITQKNILSIFTKKDKETILKNMQRRLSGHQFYYEYKELYIQTKTGSVKPIIAFTNMIEYKNKPAGFCMAVDKTKDKAYEILYKSLSEINQLITIINDENKLLKEVCKTLVNKAGFSLAAIGKIDKNTKLFETEFVSAKKRLYSETLNKLVISVDTSIEEGRGSISIAYHTKNISFISDVINDKRMSAWRKYQKELGLYSVCSIPLIKNNQVEHILVVYSGTSDFFTQNHLDLLKEFQLNLSFALNKIQISKDIALLSETMRKTHEWAVITDKEGTVLYANKAVSDISGYSKEEIIGNNPRVFKSGYHDTDFYKQLWDAITKGQEYSCRFVNRAKDGSIFYLDSIIVPIIHDGKIHRFVDLSRDVTKEVIFSRRIEFQSSIYNTLYHLTNLSINIKDKKHYLKQLSRIFVEHADIDMAFIVSLDKEQIKLQTQYTKLSEHTSIPKIINDLFEKLYKSGAKNIPAIKTLRTGKIYTKNDITEENCSPFNELAKTYGMGSCCSLPILQNGNVIAAMVMVSKHKNIFDGRLYKLLNTVSRQIEFIISKIEKEKFHNIVLAALDNGFEFVVIADKNFKIVYANKTAQILSGYREKELLGKHHSIFSSNKHNKDFSKNFYNALKKGKAFSGVFTYRVKNDKILDFITTIVPYKINNSIEYYIAMGKKLTKKEALLKEIDRLLHTDNLTGLLNTHTFMESIEKFLSIEKQNDKTGAIAIINPLSFKNINEALGFKMGDELLKQIAKRLKRAVFEYDIIAKLESDRFGLFLKDLTQEEDSLIALSKILSEISKPYKINSKTVILSFNIGLSLYPKDGKTVNDLINKAQIALIDAKTKGENQVGFFRKDFEDKASHLIQLRANLKFAVNNNEFLAYYQPYVDKNGKICGAEALIRWKKDGKTVPPMEFIPQLEQSDLIVKAENNFTKDVIKYIKQLEKENINPVSISINLSIKSLKQKNVFGKIMSKLQKYDVETKYLRIEIIERSFLENFRYLKKLMQKFKDYGVLFSVDDFGTGYSSLSYLAQLPIDYIKIDISFIKTLNLKQTQSVVNSIIFLSKELGMKTVAEGVETQEQFTTLKDMGCDYFQGYFFYRPMPADQFKEVLGKQI